MRLAFDKLFMCVLVCVSLCIAELYRIKSEEPKQVEEGMGSECVCVIIVFVVAVVVGLDLLTVKLVFQTSD